MVRKNQYHFINLCADSWVIPEKSLKPEIVVGLMNYLKYLLEGLKKVAVSLKQHKILFILLILIQIGFIAALAYITITYQVKILNTAQQIIEPLQNANYDAESIQQGKEFISQISGIYQAYQALIQQIARLALWWLGLFLIVNGALWVLSHQMLEGFSWKKAGKQWSRYAVASIVLLGPFLLAAYFLLKMVIGVQIDPDKFSGILKYLLYSFVIMYYCMLNAFAALNTVSWKELIKPFLTTAIKKIHRTLPVLIINFALLSGAAYLIYYFMEINPNFALMMAASALLMILIILTRLYWIACLQEISRKIPERHQNQKPEHEKSNS